MSSEDFGPKQWLGCNHCYKLMRDSQVPFFLSFCGHVFCPKCVKIVAKKCPQCKAPNLRTMSLIEPINPEVNHCFESIEKLNEKVVQATAFQNQQLAIVSNRLATVEKKYTFAKAEYQRKVNALKLAEKRIKELEEVIKASQRISRFDFEDSQRKMRDIPHSSAMLTPQTITGSAQSIRYSIPSSRDSLTPTKLEQMDLNSEFRIPSVTRVPRSVGSSSKNSSNSSRGTPFTFKPHRR